MAVKMTYEEKAYHEYISKLLAEDGYATYSTILSKYFTIRLTDNPKTIAYMEPSKGRITINRHLDVEQVSVVIRHEICHEYLKHEMRLLAHLAERQGLDYNDLINTVDIDDTTKLKNKQSIENLKKELYKDKTFNKAADYEISNVAYSEEDKELIRKINIGGRIVSGLVTEDGHKDWTHLSVEEIYDRLEKEKLSKPKQERCYGKLINPKTFQDFETGRKIGRR